MAWFTYAVRMDGHSYFRSFSVDYCIVGYLTDHAARMAGLPFKMDFDGVLY